MVAVKATVPFAFVTALAACLQSTALGALVLTSIGGAVPQNFDGLGTGTNLSLLNGADGWRIAAGASPTFAAGSTSLTQVKGASSLATNAAGGAYNLVPNTVPTDRAAGFLNSGSFTSPQNLMLQLTNNTGSTVTELVLSFNYEKYRNGTRAFDWTFFHGANGASWTAVAGGNQSYLADASNAGFDPPTSIPKSFTIAGLSIAQGSSYYLRWSFTGVGGSTNGQAIGVDDFSITGNGAVVPEPSAYWFGSLAIGVVVFGTAISRMLRSHRASACEKGIEHAIG